MTRRLADLDQASLDCMRLVARRAGVRTNQGTLRQRTEIQIIIREAMRAVLPPEDPRRDPAYPFNQE
ncbi:hypothetical protein [Methylobacterium pseudosasicola]|uniref:Uncharacterized protein n=1 Tax=Methylobacterium pseudosasicola TaxID=582667 RepID=A0A1I4V763_9HYPH|nr:hypothetical protein [Methylobacterium pseudosasicola]SFM97001.1 hypothetical protein SAMN05192568_10897 [Methylobacterium pseudosasicola]